MWNCKRIDWISIYKDIVEKIPSRVESGMHLQRKVSILEYKIVHKLHSGL